MPNPSIARGRRPAIRAVARAACLASALLALLPVAIEARVVRIVIDSREPLAGGRAFGDAGAYRAPGRPRLLRVRSAERVRPPDRRPAARAAQRGGRGGGVGRDRHPASRRPGEGQRRDAGGRHQSRRPDDVRVPPGRAARPGARGAGVLRRRLPLPARRDGGGGRLAVGRAERPQRAELHAAAGRRRGAPDHGPRAQRR